MSLLVLCAAAFTMVALLVSGLARAALPSLDRLAPALSPRHRARLWIGLAALPSILGLLAVGAAFLPALGVGLDHCPAHGPHHPHLCPHHLGRAPGLALVAVALLAGLRAAHALASCFRGVRLSHDTSAALAQASDAWADALVFPGEAPQAFVLGLLRPRVHLSRGLLDLGPDVVEPVLAHERIHARRRDLAWRALFPLVAVAHLPGSAAALRRRLAAAQELAADAEAAETLGGGRLQLAEALVRLARLSRAPSPGLSFTDGDVEGRVRALLAGPRRYARWPTRALLLSAPLLPLALYASHDLIHHALETLLGALG